MDARKTLERGLDMLAMPCDGDRIGKFMLYLSELKKWNRAYSITAIRDDREVVVSHFLDSALYSRGLDDTVASVADIGSGGGFPGLPLKILRPDLEVHLVEPNRKKASFLRTLTGRLGFRDVRVHEKRLDDLRDLRVDALLTRALFSVRELREGASAILNEGGRLVLSKGQRYEDELRDLEFGYEVIDVPLPFSDAVRHIIVIRT